MRITGTRDAYDVLKRGYTWDREHAKALLLAQGMVLLETFDLDVRDSGTSYEVSFDPMLIVRRAAALGTVRHVILSHSHPRQRGVPSSNRVDYVTTAQVRDLLERNGLHLVDHIILTPESYMSMRDEGILEALDRGR